MLRRDELLRRQHGDAEALFKHGVKIWTDDGAEMLDAAVDLWNEAWEIAAPKLGAVKKRRLCVMLTTIGDDRV